MVIVVDSLSKQLGLSGISVVTIDIFSVQYNCSVKKWFLYVLNLHMSIEIILLVILFTMIVSCVVGHADWNLTRLEHLMHTSILTFLSIESHLLH